MIAFKLCRLSKFICAFLLLQTINAFSAPLPANQAFQLQVKKIDPNTFILQWNMPEGYFLYKDRIRIVNNTPNSVLLNNINYPPYVEKSTSDGHVVAIYRNELKLKGSLLGKIPGETLLNVQYQGCSDQGFCYPLENQNLKVTINAHLELNSINLETASIPPQTEISNVFFQGPVTWIVLLSFYGFGLLLSFTPCVLPMIPILSGIIVGRGEQASTQHAFLLSLSYVMSMSLTYSLVGGMIALMGKNLQIILQSAWAIGILSCIFVLLALSMFNFYELRVPESWQRVFAKLSHHKNHSHYLNAAIMGALSTLILSPCVTAPMIGALSYIAQTGNVLEGVVSLFSLSLGMGTPLLLIGTSAGKLLPKAGAWMNDIKALFGLLFIAMALHLLNRLLSPVCSLFLWGVFLILTGILCNAFGRYQHYRDRLKQGLGLICLIYGILMLIGSSLGHEDLLQPLASKPKIINLTPTVTTLNEVRSAMINSHDKPVVLDFYATWCESCKTIQHEMQLSHALQDSLQNIQLITVDISANNAESRKLLTEFNIVAPPTFVFFNAQGQELTALRLVGKPSEESLLRNFRALKQP